MFASTSDPYLDTSNVYTLRSRQNCTVTNTHLR